ncbi:hypothetical protein [Kosakonia sacchari]
MAIFLEFTDENQLDQDAAINALEQVAAELQTLNADAKHHLTAIFIELSRYYPADKTAFISHLPEALGLLYKPGRSPPDLFPATAKILRHKGAWQLILYRSLLITARDQCFD